MLVEIARIIFVIALLGGAAALATPKGCLPLALRGVCRILRKDRGETAAPADSSAAKVPLWRRLLAFVLVLIAVLTALVRF